MSIIIRVLFFVSILILSFTGSVQAYQPAQADVTLVINEFMASNSSWVQDPQGQYDDWIEIYNYGANAIDMAGMSLTDDLSVPTKWRVPDGNRSATTIQPGGYLLIWADGDVADDGLHVNFELNAAGEEIALFEVDGVTPIDSVSFGGQVGNISFGRYPDASDNWRFFGEPSPGSENVSVYSGFVDEVKFSHERGFYDSPFSVTLACETEGAVIYYSVDGSEPCRVAPRGLIYGTLYTGPILISETTCLRVQAVKAGWRSSATKTHTYIFIDDVIAQSPNGESPGENWPNGRTNGQVINYGMDPMVVNDPEYAELMDEALLAIPTISFVTNLVNLFNPGQGIYVNAGRDGREWERPVSVELINPDGSEGFQIDAGLRIRGGFSRTGSNPKHAFRLFFRAEYGQSKLKFPLFGDEGVDEFDTIDLRTSQNYSWAFQGSGSNTMIREVYSRDLQGDMGQPYTRSRYYHLYINGHYWGLFQTEERPEASYAESYFGGEKDEYDVVKSNDGYSMEATDGDMDAYRRLYDGAVADLGDYANYYRIQGMNPDGTVNSEYEKLLDVDNLIDYMIIEYYTSDRDGPGSRYVGRPNNTYCIYNRNDPDGWKFIQHDSEHTLGLPGDADNMVVPFTTAGAQWRYFNPHWLHEQLIQNNADYRQRFADRVQKYLFNGGLLTTEESIARVDRRAAQIDLAIIAESARWGDSSRPQPFTKNHWLSAVNYVRIWINNRNSVLLGQFRNQNWFPRVEAPIMDRQGGQVLEGFNLIMSSADSARGILYYTLDGTDPRMAGVSEIGGGSSSVLVAEDAVKRLFVPSEPISDEWRGGNGRGFNDLNWELSVGNPGGVGYERSAGYENYISFDVEDQMYNRNSSCYIRVQFIFNDSPSDFDFMILGVRYDDGFVAYLNGVEVARRNFSGVPSWDSSAEASHSDAEAVDFEEIDISAFLNTLRRGYNILAIHGLNVSDTSSDFLVSARLIAGEEIIPDSIHVTPSAVEYAESVALAHSVHVKARVFDRGDWSALNEAVFSIGPVAESLRITEIMYNPYNSDTDNTAEPNEEYIELKNIGTQTINLNLVKFTDGVDFTFGDVELAPDEYIVVVQDIDAFEARYGQDINIAGQYSGRLNNAGERIRLEDAIGRVILDFSYKDGWCSAADGEGFSLTIIDPANDNPDSWDDKDSWRASAYTGGSPGTDDSGIIPNPGAVVINELLANSPGNSPDWIELYNTTDTAINIGGWYLSDDSSNLAKYRIADGTTIGPDDYVVFYEDRHFNNQNDPGCIESFALSGNGEQVYLSSAENGVITGYRQVEDFGASETGVSFGRYYKASTGNYNFVAMSENTPGSVNSSAKVGPVVINEIMYNPDWPEGGSYTNDQYEYIELYNISSEPVSLEGWRFTDGIDFTFPMGGVTDTIPAGGYLLVVRHPEAFMWRYPSVPADLIYGPYEGNLSNAGERLELSKPSGETYDSDVAYYIRVDRVGYSDGLHPEDCPGGVDLWRVEADGDGWSLSRSEVYEYGNDPDNWTASEPSPATINP